LVGQGQVHTEQNLYLSKCFFFFKFPDKGRCPCIWLHTGRWVGFNFLN